MRRVAPKKTGWFGFPNNFVEKQFERSRHNPTVEQY